MKLLPPFTRIGPVLAVAVALSAASARPAIAVDCPAALLQLSSASGEFHHPAAILDTTLDSDPGSTSRIAYDLGAGTLGLSMTPAAGETVFVWISDRYDVVGLPAGTPTDIEIVLEIDGTIGTPGCAGTGCGANFAALVFDQFFDATFSVAAPATAGSTTRHEVVSLPLRLMAGTPVQVVMLFHMAVAPGGNHGGEWTGRFHFTGVPTGARIVSCHGYAGETTPVQQATWGGLKTRYR